MSSAPIGSAAVPVLPPISGNPAQVRQMAAGLAAEAELLGSLARTVRGLADPCLTVWASPAGEAFGRRAAAVPGVIERVADRYGVAASALRRLATVLEEVQADVVRAQRLHAQEWGPFLQAGDQMGVAQHSADPAQRAVAGHYRAQMVAHGEQVQLAVHRHAAAHEAWAAADRACATVLWGLLDDGLGDSWAYDALTTTSSVGGQVGGPANVLSMVPAFAWLRPVGMVADGAALVSDGVLYVAYGDGDLTQLGLGAAAAAAGPVGGILKHGARATNEARIAGATTRTGRRALRVGSTDRLGAGLAETYPLLAGRLRIGGSVGMAAKPARRELPRWSRPPRRPAALRAWLHEQTAVRATTMARARFVDDFAAVLRTQGASPRWFVAGVATSATGAAADRGATERGRLLDARKEDDLRESGERHR